MYLCRLNWNSWLDLTVDCYREHWHHLANTIELELSSAYPSPQPKRQIDWLSHFCTAHGRKSIQWVLLPPKLPFPMGDLDARFLGPLRAHNANGISIGSAGFCTDDCRVSLYFTMGSPFPALNCRFPWEIWTASNTWFPGPILIGSAICSSHKCDRQTTLLGR